MNEWWVQRELYDDMIKCNWMVHSIKGMHACINDISMLMTHVWAGWGDGVESEKGAYKYTINPTFERIFKDRIYDG